MVDLFFWVVSFVRLNVKLLSDDNFTRDRGFLVLLWHT